MPTASIVPPGPILSKSVTLQSADVLAIFTTPVTIVPAPGSGLTIQPLGGQIEYIAGATPYTDGGGNLQINSSTFTGGPWMQFASLGFWDQAASQVHSLQPSSVQFVASNIVNKALQIRNNTANPTLGNGTITVTVAYMVVPVS